MNTNNPTVLPPIDDDQAQPVISSDSNIDVDGQNQEVVATVNEQNLGPNVATDADVIEKEWVDKAKHLVHQTMNDPFKQQQALSQMKAEYIKKRFNKDIKARSAE
jgi:hypothetical protein